MADDMNWPEPEKMKGKDVHISSEREKHLTQGPGEITIASCPDLISRFCQSARALA